MIRVSQSFCRSSLCHPVPAFADRQGDVAPAVRSSVDRVTALFSRICAEASTANPQAEIDQVLLFIPSHSPVCRLADTALLFCVPLCGLVAAVVAMIAQVL